MLARVDVVTEAHRLRRVAEAGPIGKRHSSFELYDLLAGCMALAEQCASGEAFQRLRALVTQQPTDGRRRYVERASDEYILVCRFVFHGLRSASAVRSNASRYAHALRQARKVGLTSANLAEHLKEQGGVNALFLTRPLDAESFSTKCLQLARGITVPKDATIRLVLRRLPDNRYDVLGFELDDTA